MSTKFLWRYNIFCPECSQTTSKTTYKNSHIIQPARLARPPTKHPLQTICITYKQTHKHTYTLTNKYPNNQAPSHLPAKPQHPIIPTCLHTTTLAYKHADIRPFRNQPKPHPAIDKPSNTILYYDIRRSAPLVFPATCADRAARGTISIIAQRYIPNKHDALLSSNHSIMISYKHPNKSSTHHTVSS